MCERCEARRERNTQIKRSAMELLFALPSNHLYPRAEATPGYLTFLSLCRQMERVSQAPTLDGAMDPEEAALMRRLILDATAEERTAALQVAEYVLDMANGTRLNLAQAKLQLKDSDTTTFAVVFQDGGLVLLVNGEPAGRIEVESGAGEEEIQDAAERAMAAHRAQHPEVG